MGGEEFNMNWWHKMVVRVRRVFIAVADSVKPREHDGGLLKLHDDIQNCGYEDVQVMWEMLRRSGCNTMMNHPEPKHRPFMKGLAIAEE